MVKEETMQQPDPTRFNGQLHPSVEGLRPGGLFQIHAIVDEESAHEGRLCRLEAVDHPVVPHRATVRFDDNGRVGFVDVRCLVPFEEDVPTA